MKKCIIGTSLLLFLLGVGVFAETGNNANTMVVTLEVNDITLDPVHSFRTDELQIATGIYEGLVSYHPENLRPVPGVAYKWDVSEDRRTYRFHLRSRARFSNGDQVTASDFRESWLRIINPESEGEYSFLFDVIEEAIDYRNGLNGDPQTVGIRAVSKTVLEVTLEKPSSHFMSMLPHMTFAPVHESYRKESGWGNRAPLISNGPFVLRQWSRDEMVLERNPLYWDNWHVALDWVRIVAVESPQKTAELLNSGEVHWADYADTSMLTNPGLIQVGPLFATSYLYFRVEEEPWSNPLVRKGLALLVPWGQLRSNASSFASRTLVPAVGFYEAPKGLVEQNVEEGLKLLEEAGYPSGRGLPDISAIVSAGSSAEMVLVEAAKIWKERLGLTVEFVSVNFADYAEVTERGGYVIGSSTWIGDFADPLSFLQMWTTNSKLNDAHYSSARYDSLVEKAMSENDEARFDTLAQAEAMLLSGEVVVIPLANPPSFNLVDVERISGWYPNALDIHPFKYMGFRKSNVPDWYVSAPRFLAGTAR